ncbi:MAG: phosphorylase family protein [Verrucomicrobiota bacterium]|jgi:adenosylhomocysteine nucleosidase
MSEPESPIAITFAVKEETKSFKGSPGVRRFLTGMGRDNAEREIEKILEKVKPRLVLTCGFAGGLNPALKNNEIVFQADDGSILHDQIRKAGATPINFFCARRVAITSEEKLRLWRGTGLDAVEMESESIRERCADRGIPSATIRVISDSAGDDLPLDFNTLMTPAQKIHYGKLSWALVRSPWKFAELLAFQHRTVEAARALGDFLDQLLSKNTL